MITLADTDLGSGHTAEFFVTSGDADTVHGITIWHPLHPECTLPACRDIGRCGGTVFFAPHAPPGRPQWEVVTLDPLTLTPSVLAHCGDHGWITDGRWVAHG